MSTTDKNSGPKKRVRAGYPSAFFFGLLWLGGCSDAQLTAHGRFANIDISQPQGTPKTVVLPGELAGTQQVSAQKQRDDQRHEKIASAIKHQGRNDRYVATAFADKAVTAEPARKKDETRDHCRRQPYADDLRRHR